MIWTQMKNCPFLKANIGHTCHKAGVSYNSQGFLQHDFVRLVLIGCHTDPAHMWRTQPDTESQFLQLGSSPLCCVDPVIYNQDASHKPSAPHVRAASHVSCICVAVVYLIQL